MPGDPLNHTATEDYLKTIFRLAQIESPVSTSRVAAARKVKPASVTSMMQKLSRQGFVNYEKHQGVTLTNTGREVALEMLRHHRLVELYLTEVLGFGWGEVHEEAEQLEHVISEKLEARLAAALDEPNFDPHGEPIPSKDGELAPVDSVLLTTMRPGGRATVAAVTDDSNSEMLAYLEALGIVPGREIVVTEVAPFEGPLTLEIDQKASIVGHKVAGNVRVTLLEGE